MSELREAAEAWVRASWHFRHGPHAYTNESQKWLIRAERRLRVAAAGEANAHAAAAALGVQLPPEKPAANKPRRRAQ